MQQQSGGVDCGVFAIANAYHAERGDTVEMLQFDQARMRQHLIQCFEKQQFSPFPTMVSLQVCVYCRNPRHMVLL